MPLGSVSPFRPTGTVSVSVGALSANALLSGGGDSVVVTNTTTSLAYIRFGSDPTVAASISDMPILGLEQVDTFGQQPDFVCGGNFAFGIGQRPVQPRRRINRLNPLTDAEKVDIRRFCGYPAYGAAPTGTAVMALFSDLWTA